MPFNQFSQIQYWQ